ncbi:hypothetical protein CC78DRAFT_607003, partial [Lojkania enalia]
MIVDKIFMALFERFPLSIDTFTRFNWRVWDFADKYRAYTEMGDIITSGRNWLYVCGSNVLTDIL